MPGDVGSNHGAYHSEDYPPGANGCTGGGDHPCNGFTINGTNRCWFHTHPTVRHKLKQQKRGKELAFIVEASIFNDTSPKGSPLEALIDELNRTQTIVRWLGGILDEMAKSDPHMLAELISTELEEGTKPMTFRGAVAMTNVIRRQMVRTEQDTSPWVMWYLREREHLVKVSTLLMQLGIKLDQLELSRRQGELVIEAMNNFAAALNIDPTDPQTATMIEAALNTVIADREQDRTFG